MTTKIERFRMAHLKGFDPRDIIADFEDTMAENLADKSKDIMTIIYKGETICVAGVNHLRIGVGEVWLIPSIAVKKCGLSFFKAVKGLVEFCIEKMGLHRIELAIDCSWEGGAKWAKSLGFEFESIARAYDFQFKDHAIYTRITRWQQEPQ